MSGIVGILHLDGAPVDRALLRRMTDFMTFRGPDEQRIWVDGNVGFGHTLLRTTFESEHEHQPLTLDGRVWIVADARVDAQADLIAKLNARVEHVKRGVPDVELLLRAYRVWGEDCIEHLLGDFVFAVWDRPRQSLFCARDHMGVKPLYYVSIGQTLVFSNTLDCVRLHPKVSDKLNDLAIADFLLFGLNLERDTTSFSDVRRLPPSHTGVWAVDRCAVQRYWALPVEDPIYYGHDYEYVDHFRDLLHQSVSDRLRTNRVSVLMSGGLDSPGLAAVAADLLNDSCEGDSVVAFCSVFERLMPDSEPYYAKLAADHIGIPIRFFAIDRQTGWARPGSRHTPEPVIDLPEDYLPRQDQYMAMASHGPVAFYGEGPDNALVYEWLAHLRWLTHQGRWGRAIGDVAKHFLQHRRVPLLPTFPQMLRDSRKRKAWEPSFPEWLEDELVERLRLRDRWRQSRVDLASPHPFRPRAYSSFVGPVWQDLFQYWEAPYTGTAIEVRHPYLDVRLLRFLLNVPAIPWCRKKQLLRRAFRGALPEELLTRPKTPLAKKPLFERAKLYGCPPVLAGSHIASYGRLAELSLNESMGSFHISFRFAALSYWLHSFELNKVITQKEEYESERESAPARSC